MERGKTKYLLNYGQTESTWLRLPQQHTSRRIAMAQAARAVRDLGGQAWAVVEQASRPGVIVQQDPIIARWRNGRRVSI